MNEQFIFGKEKAPAWFDEQAKKGRVRVQYDDDKQITGARIFSGVNTYQAKVGDTIINSKSGLVVITKVSAGKENSKKNNKEEEEK